MIEVVLSVSNAVLAYLLIFSVLSRRREKRQVMKLQEEACEWRATAERYLDERNICQIVLTHFVFWADDPHRELLPTRILSEADAARKGLWDRLKWDKLKEKL